MNRWVFLFSFVVLFTACQGQADSVRVNPNDPLIVGAQRSSIYLPLLQNKRVAVVANATSLVNGTHLVDKLLDKRVIVTKVFAPEHGFRGDVPAGEKVQSSVDDKTGIPIISLYGKHVQPNAEDLEDVDVVVFDIQDVGVRFYTYLSTLYYVMQACEQYGKDLIVLDRPNPNAAAVDGPILDMSLKSMVGVLPIPILHGCTLGELSYMITGESWGVSTDFKAHLTVVPCTGWNHAIPYELPVPPSPNLRSACAIHLYPSLCWFEGTNVSVGRGTQQSFEMFGFPTLQKPDFYFTPISIPGRVQHPPYDGEQCGGRNLQSFCNGPARLELKFLQEAYDNLGDVMFTAPLFFDKLAGTSALRDQLKNHWTEEQIRASWQPGLSSYAAIRKKYLLYP
jgi:uncharacterized protein YbbC (DUF1343 family)